MKNIILLTIDCFSIFESWILPKPKETFFAEAQSGATTIALTTMFTGTTPFTHRVMSIRKCEEPTHLDNICDYLKNKGYNTYAWQSNTVLTSEIGSFFPKWFDNYDEDFGKEIRSADGFLPPRMEEPYFLWVHLTDLHTVRDDVGLNIVEMAKKRQRNARKIKQVIECLPWDKDAIIATGDHPDVVISDRSPYLGHNLYQRDLIMPLCLYNFDLQIQEEDKKGLIIPQKDIFTLSFNSLFQEDWRTFER